MHHVQNSQDAAYSSLHSHFVVNLTNKWDFVILFSKLVFCISAGQKLKLYRNFRLFETEN